MSNCYISEKIEKSSHRSCCDNAFMGRSHSTSAIAFFLAMLAFFPAIVEQVFNTSDPYLLILIGITITGASLIPDMDNTSSTIRNSLGPIGTVASEGIRLTSVMLQTTIRTRRDDKDPNPHRGAFHTIPAGLLVGFLGFFVTGFGESFYNLPILGQITLGGIFGVLTVSTMLYLALSALNKPLMNKIAGKSPLGDLLNFSISFLICAFLYSNAEIAIGWQWLGIALFIGHFLHIFGDCFTVAGCPILFPASFFLKGKFWWNTRFTSIKAGGTIENVVFVPFFIIVSVISSARLLGFY